MKHLAPASSQTLRRGLAIIRLLTRVGPSGLSVSEISRRVDLNKATTIRLVAALLDEGFVLRDQISSRYRLGPEVFASGLAAGPSYSLQKLAAPRLMQLAKETGDTVFFMVIHGFESICLSRDEGAYPVQNQLIKPGDRWPLGVGAGSCAILAAQSDEEIEQTLAFNVDLRSTQFPLCTDITIKKLIQKTREVGYCVQPGLVRQDSWAVGVVVKDTAGMPLASISIAAMKSRLGFARSALLGNRLIEQSALITSATTN